MIAEAYYNRFCRPIIKMGHIYQYWPNKQSILKNINFDYTSFKCKWLLSSQKLIGWNNIRLNQPKSIGNGKSNLISVNITRIRVDHAVCEAIFHQASNDFLAETRSEEGHYLSCLIMAKISVDRSTLIRKI